jgi:hypothetical protein
LCSCAYIICTLAFLGIFYNCVNAESEGGLKDRPETSENFNFVAAGDFGCGDRPNKTIEGMVKKDPEIFIALGDLSYDKSAACWINAVSPLDTPGRIKIALGDHDLSKKMKKYNDYMTYFNMTKPYYSFNYQNVHFLAMATGSNSIIPYKKGSEQYNFIEEDLANAHNNKSINWIVVYSFRPFYSSLTHHLGQPILPDTYHPLFDLYGVDIILQAHNHNYQRTLPLIYNESSFFPLKYPEIKNTHDTKYKEPGAPIFITVGTGGAESHNLTGTVPYVIKQFESNGFLNIDIHNSKKELTLSGIFYESKNMDEKDRFSLTKKKIH